MEKRGLGTKATRHAIIERLEEVRYTENDPIEPTFLGRAVIDALSSFAPRITTPGMTAELESEMDDIANGRVTRETVVDHSRQLLGKVMDELIPQAAEVGETLREATAADAKVGSCPKSGHDLLIKSSPKTKGQFVGCSGWPECDVTYPLPQGKIESVDEACPECGTPQVKVIAFRTKPRVICLDPKCPTNYEPEIVIGTCSKCAEEGRKGDLKVMRSPRTLKRFVRCTNYDVCGVSYPLPQRGEIEPTGEVCEPCGSPIVVVQTGRGPWRICVDTNCSTKTESAKKPARGKSGARKSILTQGRCIGLATRSCVTRPLVGEELTNRPDGGSRFENRRRAASLASHVRRGRRGAHGGGSRRGRTGRGDRLLPRGVLARR